MSCFIHFTALPSLHPPPRSSFLSPRPPLHLPSRQTRLQHHLTTPPTARMVRVSVPIQIEAPPPLVHSLFSDLTRMPDWSATLQSVTRDADNPLYSDWTFSWLGIRLSWRAKEPDEQRDDYSIRWTSVSGLEHTGLVEFEPEGDGTRVCMTVDYDIASLLAAVMESRMVAGFVEGAIEKDLQRFRSFALRVRRKERIEERKAVR